MTAPDRTRAWLAGATLRACVGLLAASAVSGCGLGGGTVPVVWAGGEEPGFKLLRPNLHARSCGAVLWPYGGRAGGDLLERAVAELVAQNREADTIRNLHVGWRGIDLLVAQVGCASARGDVGRTIPVVTLPHLHGGMDTSHPH